MKPTTAQTVADAAAYADRVAHHLEAYPDSEPVQRLYEWARKIVTEWAPGATVPDGRHKVVERAITHVFPEIHDWNQADIAAEEIVAAIHDLKGLPEPKPWHNARYGEVWEITVDGDTIPAIVTDVLGSGVCFQPAHSELFPATSSEITDGRLIYPLVKSAALDTAA